MSEHVETTPQKPLRDQFGRILPGQKPVCAGSGGRPGGTTIARAEVMRICRDRNYHPIHALIDVAQDPHASLYLKAEVADKIANFLIPKLKTVQVTGPDGDGDGVIHITWDSPEQAAERARKALNGAGEAIQGAVIDEELPE